MELGAEHLWSDAGACHRESPGREENAVASKSCRTPLSQSYSLKSCRVGSIQGNAITHSAAISACETDDVWPNAVLLFDPWAALARHRDVELSSVCSLITASRHCQLTCARTQTGPESVTVGPQAQCLELRTSCDKLQRSWMLSAGRLYSVPSRRVSDGKSP